MKLRFVADVGNTQRGTVAEFDNETAEFLLRQGVVVETDLDATPATDSNEPVDVPERPVPEPIVIPEGQHAYLHDGQSAAGAAAEAAPPADDPLDGMKLTELKSYAETLGLTTSGSKAEVADRIRAHQLTVDADETRDPAPDDAA